MRAGVAKGYAVGTRSMVGEFAHPTPWIVPDVPRSLEAQPMIFRPTHKLARKIGVALSERLPLDANPFADWSANLFIFERVQHVILTNTASLYSMLMLGRGITDDSRFLDRAVTCMREFMSDDRNEDLFREFVMPHAGMALFSKSLDRSVLGSMNELVYLAKWHLADGLSLAGASRQVNHTPMSPLRYRNPREAFRSLKEES